MEEAHHAKALQLLGAIEGPARLWPRDRLELGLLPPVDGDDGIIGVDRLHKAAVASLNPAESHDTIGFGIRCLSALGELCLELECSERLGLIGGHHTVLRLMTEGCCVSRDRDARRLQKEKSLNSAPPEQQGQQPHNGNCCCIPVHLAGTGAAGDDATSARGETVTAVSGPPAAAADGGDDDDGDDCEKQEGEEDEVQSAAALVAAHVVSSGSSFPMRPSFHAADGPSVTGRFPLRYDFVVADSTSTSTSSPAVHCTSTTPAAAVPDGSVMAASGLVLEEPSEGCLTAAAVDACTTTTSVRQHSAGDMPGGESISILVRPVNERQHSQFDVGFVMWPAAVILSRLLCRHPEIIRGRRVLEIGAGLGLAGLVAARIQQTPLSAPMVPPEDLAMADCIAVGTSSRSGGCPNLAAGASVTLSDFNPLVLKALEANVALNARSGASTDDAAGEVGKSAGGFRQQSPDSYREGGDSGGTPGRHVCTGAERQAVYVRHLDWDKLNIAPNVVDDCRSGSLGNGDGSDAKVSRRPAGEGAAENGDRCASSERDGDDTDFSPPLNSTDSSGPQCGGMKGIEHGDCFDVIIASDHICQASDAEGSIRVLRSMLAEASPTPPPPGVRRNGKARGRGGGSGGHAHFVVAHPRTRWGVDALVPLLEQCPELSFTCEDVTDPELVAGVEEASYLAWLHVHVWRRSLPDADADADAAADADADAAAAAGGTASAADWVCAGQDGDGDGEAVEPAPEVLLVAG